jgi:hypothetical protein
MLGSAATLLIFRRGMKEVSKENMWVLIISSIFVFISLIFNLCK